jgi:DNA primase
MKEIEQARARMPLPKLMEALGYGAHARKSARCPFHADRSPSFGIYQKGGRWFWKCFAGCGGGDEIAFLERVYGMGTAAAIYAFRMKAGIT